MDKNKQVLGVAKDREYTKTNYVLKATKCKNQPQSRDQSNIV